VSVADTAIAKAYQGNSLVALTPPLPAPPAPAPAAEAPAAAAPMAISIAATSAPVAPETHPAAPVISAAPATYSQPAIVAAAPPATNSANGHRASRRAPTTKRTASARKRSSLLARLVAWAMG
jgi:hypothetical protein